MYLITTNYSQLTFDIRSNQTSKN